jgi:hypothetical protein
LEGKIANCGGSFPLEEIKTFFAGYRRDVELSAENIGGSRYAHHYSESLRAGIEILDRVPSGFSTVLAQSAHSAMTEPKRRSMISC